MFYPHYSGFGSQGWLDKLVDNMGTNNVNITKCAACQYGKQERHQKSVTSQSKGKESKGSLKRNQLEPGKIIFSDQYE